MRPHLISTALMLLACWAAVTGVVAAERSPNKKKPPQSELRLVASKAEMPVPDDTPVAWHDQQALIQASQTLPYFTGAFLWRGRADRDYMPFHQWELRLHTGASKRDALRLRLDALGPDLKPLHGKEGHEISIGDLPAGEQVHVSYKLNTSHPASYRVQLRWAGGEQLYLAPAEGHQLPQPFTAGGDQPLLLVLQPHFEYEKAKKTATVRFYLRNDGGVAAQEVKHRIVFKDSKGQQVHSHEYSPKDGTVPPGYAAEQVVVVKQCPHFSNIGIMTSKKEPEAETSGGVSLDPGRFTASRQVELAEFALVEGVVSAKVRNGLKEDLPGVQIDLQLFDGTGQLLKELAVPIGDLASGAIAPLRAEVGELAPVAGWGFGWQSGIAAGTDEAPRSSMLLGALEVSFSGVAAEKKNDAGEIEAIVLQLRFDNQGSAVQPAASIKITVTDPSGKTATSTTELPELAPQTQQEQAVAFAGVSGVAGFGVQVR